MDALLDSILQTLQGWSLKIAVIAMVCLGLLVIWSFTSGNGLRGAIAKVAIVLLGVVIVGAASAIVDAINQTAESL